MANALELHEARGYGYGRVQIRQIVDVSAASLLLFLRETIPSGSTVKTDGWST